MTLTTNESIIFFTVICIATVFMRVLPFAIFPDHRVTPKYISYLGNVLPLAVIAMLVVYSLKDISFTQTPFGIPEIISVVAIIIMHLWKENTLLSIGAGTILYMLLVQFIF